MKDLFTKGKKAKGNRQEWYSALGLAAEASNYCPKPGERRGVSSYLNWRVAHL